MKSTVIYMGLFLILLSLYAVELSKPAQSHEVSKKRVVQPNDESVPIDRGDPRLVSFFERLMHSPVFSSHTDGLKVLFQPNRLLISFYGDDVYQVGAFAFRETWFPVLDELGAALNEEMKKGMHVQIKGFTDQDNPHEKSPTDYNGSDLSFSYARAEWVARYFERKWGMPIHSQFEMIGSGAQPHGNRVDLTFTY